MGRSVLRPYNAEGWPKLVVRRMRLECVQDEVRPTCVVASVGLRLLTAGAAPAINFALRSS